MGDETPAAGARTVAPFGSWASPIDVELVAGTSLSLAEPFLDGDDGYWIEGRPAEAGRRTLLRHGADGRTVELTPAPFRVGNRVHEYGGGSYAVRDGLVVVSSLADGRLYRIDPDPATGGHGAPVPLTPEGPWRYADLTFDPVRDRLLAVRETHDPERPDDHRLVANELVAIPLDGSGGEGRVLVSGPDFVAAPRPSPDGAMLAWVEWDLPDMPWDATRLRVAPFLADGGVGVGEARTIAGGPGISVGHPAWGPGGVLHAISDETAWWNLYAWDGPDGLAGDKRNVAPMDAEIGHPAWVLGGQPYAFVEGGELLAVARADGHDGLLRIDAHGTVTRLESAWTEVYGLRAHDDRALPSRSARGPRRARPSPGSTPGPAG